MIFGALSGWVVAGLAAGVAALVAYIFLMKVKHPRVLVPSLLLWRRVLDEDRDVSFWEKVRKAVSLAIAILVPLLIVLALGRPERGSSAAAAGPLTIVIDSSLSMLAERPGGRTRWDAATSRAIALAGDDEVTILTTADGIVAGPTTDRELLRVSLQRVKPAEPGPFPIGRPELQLRQDNVVFLTDGITPYDVPSNVRVESVFASADNAAITAFDVRSDFRSRGRYEAYVEVANYSADARQVTLAVTLGSNRIYEQQVQLGADEIVRQSMPFEAGAGGVLKAELVGLDDALAEDDEAYAWVASARPKTVTLVTRRNPPLETLLSFDGNAQVNRIEPEEWGTGVAPQALSPRSRTDTGVVIFDRWAPERPPSQPAIYIAPPAAPWLVIAEAPERNATWSRADEGHAAVRGVDGRTLRFDEVNVYELNGWTPVAFTGRGNPLVAVRDAGDASQAILTFDVTRGNIANDSAFPVLIGDLLAWFERTPPVRVQAPGAVRLPGDVTSMRREGAGVGGGNITLRRLGDVAIADLRAPGVYIADRPAGQIAIAINAGSRASSNIRPSTIAQDAGTDAPRASSGLWIWLVAIALVLFAAEFYTWHRRITV